MSDMEEAMAAALKTLGPADEFESWNLDSGNLASFIAAYEAKLSETHVRVPREPTEAMVEAGQNEGVKLFEDRATVGYIYRAMIQAAPNGGR